MEGEARAGAGENLLPQSLTLRMRRDSLALYHMPEASLLGVCLGSRHRQAFGAIVRGEPANLRYGYELANPTSRAHANCHARQPV